MKQPWAYRWIDHYFHIKEITYHDKTKHNKTKPCSHTMRPSVSICTVTAKVSCSYNVNANGHVLSQRSMFSSKQHWPVWTWRCKLQFSDTIAQSNTSHSHTALTKATQAITKDTKDTEYHLTFGEYFIWNSSSDHTIFHFAFKLWHTLHVLYVLVRSFPTHFYCHKLSHTFPAVRAPQTTGWIDTSIMCFWLPLTNTSISPCTKMARTGLTRNLWAFSL